MSLDQTILLWCVLVPAVIAAGGSLASGRLWRTSPGLAESLSWWIAVTASLALCQGWRWWPEEAWRQAIWPLLAWVILICGTSSIESLSSVRWIVAAVLASVTAMIAMPSGEGWEDTFALHRTWIPLVTASCLVNSFALERMSKAGGYRWVLLVALAGLGGPMALAVAAYGSLAEWALSMVVATGVIAALGVFSEWNAGRWTVATPAVVGAAGITTAARFYSYETYPAWVISLILFAPCFVAIVDLAFRNRSSWVRVIVSGIVSAGIVAVCVWRVLLA